MTNRLSFIRNFASQVSEMNSLALRSFPPYVGPKWRRATICYLW